MSFIYGLNGFSLNGFFINWHGQLTENRFFLLFFSFIRNVGTCMYFICMWKLDMTHLNC